jgi:hypothetical protein
MTKVDIDWVKNQFSKINIHKGTGLAVIELLNTWESLDIKKPEVAKTVLAVFTELAQGHSIVPSDNFTCVQARRGDIKVRDIIRVKADAFTGEAGHAHNGRTGVVIAIRSGDIIVDLTDEQEPEIKGAHYNPDLLEKRVSA